MSKCLDCNGSGYNSYPNHDTAYPTCHTCSGTGINPSTPNEANNDKPDFKFLEEYLADTRGYSDNEAKSLQEEKMTSEKIIGTVKERFNELRHKNWDWSSFYHGWIEGRANMWANRQPPFPSKSLAEIKDEVVYEIEFGNHLACRIIVSRDGLNIAGAMNGWGDAVPVEEIKINQQPASQFRNQPVNDGWVKVEDMIKFVKWYSGMEEEPVERSYKRYLQEKTT